MKFTIPLTQTPLSHQQYIKHATNRWGSHRTYKDHKLAAYQQEICLLAKMEVNKQRFKRIEGPYSIKITFYLKNRKHPDLDNMWKAISDAWEGLLYSNDRNCKELALKVAYDLEKPQICVEIEALWCVSIGTGK